MDGKTSGARWLGLAVLVALGLPQPGAARPYPAPRDAYGAPDLAG